jgi:hypothetical protein
MDEAIDGFPTLGAVTLGAEPLPPDPPEQAATARPAQQARATAAARDRQARGVPAGVLLIIFLFLSWPAQEYLSAASGLVRAARSEG